LIAIAVPCAPSDLSYKEATWEYAQDLEDEVIADLFRLLSPLNSAAFAT
jgi:hypothetical protein